MLRYNNNNNNNNNICWATLHNFIILTSTKCSAVDILSMLLIQCLCLVLYIICYTFLLVSDLSLSPPPFGFGLLGLSCDLFNYFSLVWCPIDPAFLTSSKKHDNTLIVTITSCNMFSVVKGNKKYDLSG
jgi:hypothetical protein